MRGRGGLRARGDELLRIARFRRTDIVSEVPTCATLVGGDAAKSKRREKDARTKHEEQENVARLAPYVRREGRHLAAEVGVVTPVDTGCVTQR